MEQQENNESQKGEELIEILKNNRYKVSSILIKNQRGKTFLIKDSPLLFKIVEVEKDDSEEKNVPVSFPKKNKRNTIRLVIKFWDKDLFISLQNSGFKNGYTYRELPSFYVVIPLNRIQDFSSMYLQEKRLVENY